MSSTPANKARYAIATKQIDFANDVFKCMLMDSGFTFDPDTHHGYADVSGSELATGNGYTTGGATLTGVAVTENDTTDLTEITWSSITWTAVTGSIGPTPGAIIYDDTPTTPQADPLIGYIDFDGEQTQVVGGVASIINPKVTL